MQLYFRTKHLHNTQNYYVYTFATTQLILFKVHELVTIQMSQLLTTLGLVAYIVLFYK